MGFEVRDLFKRINSTHRVLYSELAQVGQKHDLKPHSSYNEGIIRLARNLAD